VVDAHPALGHHLLEVPQTQRVSRIPTHAHQHHLQRKVQALQHPAEGRIHQLDVQGNHEPILADRLTATQPLPEHMVHMVLDGRYADRHLTSDLFVEQASPQHLENFSPAACQCFLSDGSVGASARNNTRSGPPEISALHASRPAITSVKAIQSSASVASRTT